jgi:hypothetical protein
MESPHKVTAAYVNALGDHPVWAIESVCKALARGLVEGVNPTFPPSAAVVAQQCENKTVDMREEKSRFVRLLSIKDIRAPQLSEEELAGIRARHEEWKVKNQKPDPITEEEQRRREEASSQAIAASQANIIGAYKAMGRRPHYASDGTLISPSLLKSIGVNPKTVLPPMADMDKP